MIYVYCVTDREPDLEPSAFGRCGNGVYTIGNGGLFAVVNRVSAEEFDGTHINQRMEDTEWLKSKILEHEATVERIMLDGPLLPFKFATVFESEENVVKMLDENNAAFSAIIDGFRGKEEWGVRIYVDIEPLRSSLTDGDEEIGALDRDIRGAAPGKAYILRKKREDLIGALAGRTMYEYGELCLEALKARSVLVRTNRLLPQEITGRKDEMILNAVFLVNKGQMEAFRDTLEGLRAKYGPAGFSFDLTGPWPPYNFCSSTMDDGV